MITLKEPLNWQAEVPFIEIWIEGSRETRWRAGFEIHGKFPYINPEKYFQK